MTLESQYKQYVKDNPGTSHTFDGWEQYVLQPMLDKAKHLIENKLTLEECSFKFSQNGNCLDGGEDAFEEITVKYRSDLGLDREEGGFFTITTENWSVDSEKNFEELFNRIKKVHNENTNK